ncbi:MAG: zinc ribbon domain-containing protein [Fluviibacter sp.]
MIWACFGDQHTSWSRPAEKKCPYCAEYIKSEAIKCKHCGSDLTEAEHSVVL